MGPQVCSQLDGKHTMYQIAKCRHRAGCNSVHPPAERGKPHACFPKGDSLDHPYVSFMYHLCIVYVSMYHLRIIHVSSVP